MTLVRLTCRAAFGLALRPFRARLRIALLAASTILLRWGQRITP